MIQKSLLFIICVLVFFGCRTPEGDFPRIINEPGPVPESTRSTFGVIGLLPYDDSSGVRFSDPAGVGEAIGEVAAGSFGALDPQLDGDELGNDLGALAFSAVFSGVAGLIGGVLSGVPEADLVKAQAALRTAIEEEALELSVHTQIRTKGEEQILTIPKSALGEVDAVQPYASIAGRGIQSLLMVRIGGERFIAGEGLNPPMVFAAEAHVQVVSTADGRVLYEKTLDYRGAAHRFTVWARGDAKLFRAELAAAADRFSEITLEQVMANFERRITRIP